MGDDGIFAQRPLAAKPFNRTYDFGLFNHHFRNLMVRGDTIVGYGIMRDSLPPCQQCLFVARFDSSGTFIDYARMCDNLGRAYTMDAPWSELTGTSDGGYAMTGASIARYDGLFLKLGSDLSVDFVQEYADPVNFVEYYRKVVELPGGYLLFGDVQRPNYSQEPFARKVDKQGNTLWFKYLGEDQAWDFFPHHWPLSAGEVLCSGGYQISTQPTRYNPWMAVVDTNGNFLREWKPTEDVGMGIVHYAYPFGPDKWVLSGKRQLGLDTVQSWVGAMDTNFVLEFLRDVGKPTPRLGTFWDIRPTPDGNFIGAGQANFNDGMWVSYLPGWLHKFSPAGDSLWSREDLPPHPAGEPPSQSYLAGVGVLSSGSVVAGGSTTIGGTRYCWLLKVTPDGCLDTLLCLPVGAAEPVVGAAGMRLYPNPAGQEVWVGLPEGWPSTLLTINDLNGRAVLHRQMGSTVKLDISALSPGLYFVRVADSTGKSYAHRLVVAR
jgi:hypothetical protein